MTLGLRLFLHTASFSSMSLVLSRVCQGVEIFCSWWSETLNQPKALRSRVPTAMSSWKDGLKTSSLPPFLVLSALPDPWLGSCLTSPHVGLQRKDFRTRNLEHYLQSFFGNCVNQLGWTHTYHSYHSLSPVTHAAAAGIIFGGIQFPEIFFFLLLVLFSSYAILFLDLAGDLLINYHILNRAIHLSRICLHFILWPNAQQLFKYQIITIPLSWFKTFPPLILPDCAFNVLN